MSRRFCAILDPCGAYFIWDDLKLEPVMARSGRVLAFAGHAEAWRSADRLNGNDNEDKAKASTTSKSDRSCYSDPPTNLHFSLAAPDSKAEIADTARPLVH